MSEFRAADLAFGYPPGHFLAEELEARGWTSRDLALRMGGETEHELAVDELSVDLVLHIDDPRARMGKVIAKKLARAFGTSVEFWLNLDQHWREWCDAHPEEAARINAKVDNA